MLFFNNFMFYTFEHRKKNEKYEKMIPMASKIRMAMFKPIVDMASPIKNMTCPIHCVN